MIVDFWENMVRWCARLCLYLKYGMSVDDYYKQLARGPETQVRGGYQPFVSPDPEAFPFVYTSPYTGKQNIGDRDMPYYPQGQSNTALLALMKSIEQEIEVRWPIEPSPPMDYYPSMPDEDEWIAEEQQEALDPIPLDLDLSTEYWK